MSTTSTNVKVVIYSYRFKKYFEVKRFTEFNIQIDLETDSDSFDLVAKNPGGCYTGIFCRFDAAILYVNGKKIMCGNIDDVAYYCNKSDNYIRISGRDRCWKLVDNDAIPNTLKNVKPKSYIKKKCEHYNIKYKLSDSNIYPSLDIGCGESEISIMNNILLNSKHRIWYLVDTLYTGNWNTDSKAVKAFSDNNTKGVLIEDLELTEDGAEMKSEVIVYADNSDGKEKVKAKYVNTPMQNRYANKRETMRYYSESSSTKYSVAAKREVRDKFRNNIELKLTVRINSDDTAITLPNRCVDVKHSITGINGKFFVKASSFTKSINDGSKMKLTLIPADSLFEKLWKSNGDISVTNLTKSSKKLAYKK